MTEIIMRERRRSSGTAFDLHMAKGALTAEGIIYYDKYIHCEKERWNRLASSNGMHYEELMKRHISNKISKQ
jgi:hypothetical protein